MTEPDPDLGRTQRLVAIREGMAEGRNMGLWGEVADVIDAIAALRENDKVIIATIRNIAERARDAIQDLRADATAEFLVVRGLITTARNDAATAIGNEMTARQAADTGETNARVAADTTLQSNITSVQNQATTAIGQDRNRLTALESALNNPTTGTLARLTAIEARLTALETPPP